MNTSGLFSREAIVSARRVTESLREFTMAVLRFFVQRLSPIPTPPK